MVQETVEIDFKNGHSWHKLLNQIPIKSRARHAFNTITADNSDHHQF